MRRTDEWVPIVEDRLQMYASGVRRVYEDRRGRKIVRWRGQWWLVTETHGPIGVRYLLSRPA